MDTIQQNLIPKVAKSAFEKALQTIETLHKGVNSVDFDKHANIASIMAAIEAAQARYVCQKQDKARKWLTRLSARITHYGSILDVFAQYHPEYTALVWGSFKLVFIVSLEMSEFVFLTVLT